MREVGERARGVARPGARTDGGKKCRARRQSRWQSFATRKSLLAANALDVAAARAAGSDAAFVDRLTLHASSVAAMAEGVREIATLADPVGEISELKFRPSGIQVGHMRVPLGVVGIVYESRPNVTADAAALCLKSGNACILRGGSEALHSNRAIAACVREGLTPCRAAGGRGAADRDHRPRGGRRLLATMDKHVDVLIPRGGKGLDSSASRRKRRCP